jgi:hypothetical protein
VARQTQEASLLAKTARMLFITMRLLNQVKSFTRKMTLLLVSSWLQMEGKTH